MRWSEASIASLDNQRQQFDIKAYPLPFEQRKVVDMRLGLSLTSHHSALPPAEAVATTLARASAAGAVGLDHLTVGDRHSVGPNGSYLQGVPILARILADWPSDRSAGLLFLLPLWPPVLVAEMVGTLAAMSDAPFIVQTGIGDGEGQFAAMNASLSTRGSTTSEAIGVISRLLQGEIVTSERFGVEKAAVGPTPVQPIEWWIGSGKSEAALARAARLGDALYLAPGWGLDDVVGLSATYRSLCAALDRPSRVVLRRDVYVADDDTVGVSTGDRLAASGYRGMSRDVLVCGGVGRVVDLLEPFARAGVDDVVARTIAVSSTEAVRSVELLGLVREGVGPVTG